MKQIKFKHDGKEYILAYTRESVERLEKEGFDVRNVNSMPISTIPMLFRGAFYANHSDISKEKIEELYRLFKDKQKLIEVLGEMIADPINSLFEEPDEKNAIAWDAIL